MSLPLKFCHTVGLGYLRITKQVDSLIPKNQVLQIFYLKHHTYKFINYHG